MRNLSKTIVLEKVSLMQRKTTMKKVIIAFITVIMAIAVNTANAEIVGMMLTKQEVATTIMEANPIAGPKEIDACYDAMKHDGFYRIHSSKVRIICTKNNLTRVWTE